MNEREQPYQSRVAAAFQPKTLLIRLLSLILTFALGAQSALAELAAPTPRRRQRFRDVGRGRRRPAARGPLTAHVSVLLGHHEQKERARPRSLSDPFVREHRRDRLLAHCESWSALSASYVKRAQASDRTLKTLRFLAKAPQGPEATGNAGHQGFYYHFLNPKDGLRFGGSELSTVDTALLLGGVLLAQSYFDGPSRAEREIRQLADHIYQRVDWQWAQSRAACHLARLDARERVSFARLGRLQRGDAGVRARARVADARGRSRSVEAVDGLVRSELGQVRRAGAAVVRPAVRPSVLARLGRLSRHPGRVHAREGHRLLREQPPRRLRAARVCQPEPDAVARLRQ